ncbi:type I toxin-antitoxin system SymE family toxin [Enterobacteriaceae bacterium 4M9]|nr:type I toxin-antitoxin system SymE family toxin [Enterobacteriaceae bacterium 4M9]
MRDSRTFTSFPSITLKGNWMKTLGFETGQKIEVQAEPGQLIVRMAAEG